MNPKERLELKNILQSPIFAKALQQARLLEYLCNEYFEGRAGQIKEYNIATELLGREAKFDSSRDAIVRVEMRRLRQKLKVYYDGEGADHSLRLVIDPGSYAPRFVPSEATASIGTSTHPQTPEGLDSKPALEIAKEIAQRGRSVKDVRPLLFVAGGLALVVLAAVLLKREFRLPWLKTTSVERHAPVASVGAEVSSLDSVRILCGFSKEKYIDRDGNTWRGDRYYSGGVPNTQQPLFIARAPELALFRTFRSGDFSYDIPLKPGNYEMRLYFAETHLGPGTLAGGGETGRLFNVQMNGKPLLEMFDIIEDAGGNNIADIRAFKDVTPAPDGCLHLKFEPVTYLPLLNALEIEPSPPGKINPIRIVTEPNSYTDNAGNIWKSDRYYSGGQLGLHITRVPVSRTPDPDLYSSERYGNFNYALPAPPGKYRLTLRFAETYWGVESYRPGVSDQGGSPVGGIGSRVFDVYCNGVVLLRNFDILKEAGGPLTAIDKTFHNLEPNAQGKIVLNFVPVKDYAKVTAIELISEPD